MPRFYLEYFEPSRPLDVRGGIKARSTRGGFGKSWWARRWIEALEDFNLGARLSRGRSYARRGQVLSIEIEKGVVTASVQGSRPWPYEVEINVRTLDGSDWEKMTASLFEQPVFIAKLLAGQMPENIEDLFRDTGLSLFPDRDSDLETDCSCPDWSNPCKHVAAVYLLLGEEFDRDPFLVFRLRGMEREELVGLVKDQAAPEDTLERFYERMADRSCPEPLPLDPEVFWGSGNAGEKIYGAGNIPTTSAALPRRLGNFPFWRGEKDFISTLEGIYSKASPAGQEVFLGK